jgi:hypothetical protein
VCVTRKCDSNYGLKHEFVLLDSDTYIKNVVGREPIIASLELYILCVIAGFTSEVVENCALLGYYKARSGNLVPTFRNNP